MGAIALTIWFLSRRLLGDVRPSTTSSEISPSVVDAYCETLKFITLVRFSVPNVILEWKNKLDGPAGSTVYAQSIGFLLGLIGIGAICSGFFIVWIFVFVILLAPGVFYNGFHESGLEVVKPFVSEMFTEVMEQIYKHINSEEEESTKKSSAPKLSCSYLSPPPQVSILREASDEELSGFFKID